MMYPVSLLIYFFLFPHDDLISFSFFVKKAVLKVFSSVRLLTPYNPDLS